MDASLEPLFTELRARQQGTWAAVGEVNRTLGLAADSIAAAQKALGVLTEAQTGLYDVTDRIKAAADPLIKAPVVVVPPTPPVVVPPVDPNAMPAAAPTGWKRVVSEDFLTDIPRGGVLKALSAKGFGFYDNFKDTFKGGTYSTDRTSLTKNGDLEVNLRTEAGVALSFAIAPTAWKGQLYGRYAVRFRSDKIEGRKIAWLLWPEDNDWLKGEVNFPEGDCGGDILLFAHKLGTPSINQVWGNTGVKMTDWHTCVIEWTPGKLRYLLDGVLVKETTDPLAVPKTPMRWTLQCESGNATPSATGNGTIEIAWLTQDALA